MGFREGWFTIAIDLVVIVKSGGAVVGEFLLKSRFYGTAGGCLFRGLLRGHLFHHPPPLVHALLGIGQLFRRLGRPDLLGRARYRGGMGDSLFARLLGRFLGCFRFRESFARRVFRVVGYLVFLEDHLFFRICIGFVCTELRD